jgi:Rod binding domain-containing protein
MIVPVPSTPGAAGATTGATPATTPTTTDPAIREAAQGFEGIFMSMLVEEMMKGSQVAEANPVYSGLMTQKLGDQLARSGGIGLADILERQLGGAAATTTPDPTVSGGDS